MSNWREELDEIFGLKSQKSLEADTPVNIEVDTFSMSNKGYIELTLNYPRTVNFKRLPYEYKIEVYKNLLLYILKHISILKDVKYSIENCKDGTPHMHASIRVVGTFSRYGLVEQVVTTYLSQLTKRYNKYSTTNFNLKYCRYRCPSIVCQYTENEDNKRVANWDIYMNKISPSIVLDATQESVKA